MVESAVKPVPQYAALPIRRHGGRTEVLLITSRETRRWVIPKGWPIKGLSPSETAAREAMEEAGAEGKIANLPLGHYHYPKRLRNGETQLCRVEVFPLEVTRLRPKWPEAGQRGRRWFDPSGAALAVEEFELANLFRHFR